MVAPNQPQSKEARREAYLFSVKPFGDRWAIVCGADVIAIAETEYEAARLAINAAGSLRIGPKDAVPSSGHSRSFADW